MNIHELLEDFNLNPCIENLNRVELNYQILKLQQELYLLSLKCSIYRIDSNPLSFKKSLKPYIPKQPELTLTRLKKPKQLITKTYRTISSLIHNQDPSYENELQNIQRKASELLNPYLILPLHIRNKSWALKGIPIYSRSAPYFPSLSFVTTPAFRQIIIK